MNQPEDFLTYDELAEALNISGKTVRKWFRKGFFPAVRDGMPPYLFDFDEVVNSLRHHRVLPQLKYNKMGYQPDTVKVKCDCAEITINENDSQVLIDGKEISVYRFTLTKDFEKGKPARLDVEIALPGKKRKDINDMAFKSELARALDKQN